MAGLNVSTPGSIHSQASGAIKVGAGLKATSCTPSARPLRQIASNPSHGSPTTTGFGGPTGIPSTGNGSSPVTGTTTGPQTVVGPAIPSGSPVKPNTTGPQTFVGPAVPSGSPRPDTTTDTQMLAGPAISMDGLNVSTPGSIPSQASGAFNVGAGLKATSSTPSARPLGQIASNPSHGSPAAAIVHSLTGIRSIQRWSWTEGDIQHPFGSSSWSDSLQSIAWKSSCCYRKG